MFNYRRLCQVAAIDESSCLYVKRAQASLHKALKKQTHIHCNLKMRQSYIFPCPCVYQLPHLRKPNSVSTEVGMELSQNAPFLT